MTARRWGVCLLALTLLSVGAALVQAAVKLNQRIPFFKEVEIPCTADFVRLEGYLHLVSSSTRDNAGGFEIMSHANPQGLSGVSLLGVNYQGTGVTQKNFTVKPPFPLEHTEINSFRIIGNGPRNDFTLHITMHYTVNADGEVTADVYKTWVSCGTGG